MRSGSRTGTTIDRAAATAGAPAAIQARIASFCAEDNGTVGESAGGISPRRTSSQSSDSPGDDGTTRDHVPEGRQGFEVLRLESKHTGENRGCVRADDRDLCDRR